MGTPREACGLGEVVNAENTPLYGTEDALIVPLGCSLAGHEAAPLPADGSQAAQLVGAERGVERYHCDYGPIPRYLETPRSRGPRFTDTDGAGYVRGAELPGHPFFVAAPFRPELPGDGTRAHRVIRGPAAAAVRHAGA